MSEQMTHNEMLVDEVCRVIDYYKRATYRTSIDEWCAQHITKLVDAYQDEMTRPDQKSAHNCETRGCRLNERMSETQ